MQYQFGVREICNVVFKAKTGGTMGNIKYVPGQPVLYIDSAKTSTMEGASTTVYATGGRGNSRLISWEGERTLTFTVEDALLSPIGFAILSGAGLMNATEAEPVYAHVSSATYVGEDGVVNLKDILQTGEKIDLNSPIFVMKMEKGVITEKLSATSTDGTDLTVTGLTEDSDIFLDFYVVRKSGASELTIDAGNFAGSYYVEANTLFRRRGDNKDLPAELIFPNVKIQSNFTFSMAATGDPSTFTFTMDAMPGYTRFNRKKRVLCAIQIMEDDATDDEKGEDSIKNAADADLEYPLSEDEGI